VIYPGVVTKKKVPAGAPYAEPARLGRVALSWCCNLSKKQVAKAKTVTSLFTLLTVLAKVYFTLKITSNGSIIDFDLSSILHSIDPDC
jgi:hypothetical protein